MMMFLLAGVAQAQPKPVVSAPAAFSQGEAGDASAAIQKVGPVRMQEDEVLPGHQRR